MKRVLVFVAACLLAAGSAACGEDDPAVGTDEQSQSEAPASNTVKVTETNYAFQVDGSLRAGTVTLEVENAGTELHEVAMAKLLDGKTMEDVKAALDKATPETEFALEGVAEEDTPFDDIGNGQAPGTGFSVTTDGIEAGEYALICFIPNSEGVPHFKLGMLAGLTIAEGDITGGPEADQTYTVTDEKLDGPTELTAGETTLSLVNDSSVNREIMMLKLKEGKTVEDGGKFFESAENGPPDFANSPFDFFTFVFDSDRDRKITVDLAPGQWYLETPDPENQFEGPPEQNPHGKLITVA